jgi:hypothetical protein
MGSMVSRAMGHHGDNGVAGSRRRTTLQTQRWHRSMASWAREWRGVHSITGSGRMTLLRAREWRRRLGDGACVVNDITKLGKGRWRCVKGLDHGWELWHGGSGEDSMIEQAPGRSMMARAPRKFLAGNFGSLTT